MVSRVGIYVRVSSKKQEDRTSLKTQEQEIRRWLTEHHPSARVVKIYKEVYSGAYLYDRPALTEAWHDMQDGTIDALAAYSVDRLSRDGAHLVVIGQDCERHGVELIIVSEPMENTPEAELIRYLKGWAAKIERKAIIERSMRAHLARARSGKLRPGYKPRYGYRWADEAKTRFEVYEPEAALVRRIYDLRESGVLVKPIADALTREGIQAPGGGYEWHDSTVYEMLRYEGYAGRGVTYRSTPNPIELPEGVIPAIVSREQFERIQVLMREAKREAPRNNRRAESFLLRGHAFCECGKRMWTDGVLSNGFIRYICPDVRKPTHLRTCQRRNQIDAGMLDREVWAEIEQRMTDESFWESALGLVMSEAPRPALDVDRIESRLRELERARRKYLDARAEADDPEDRAYYGLKLDSLKGEIEVLRRERDKLLSLNTEHMLRAQHLEMMKAYSRQMAEVVRARELTYQEKRDALALFDAHIVVHPFSGKRVKRWESRGILSVEKLPTYTIDPDTTSSVGVYVITWDHLHGTV